MIVPVKFARSLLVGDSLGASADAAAAVVAFIENHSNHGFAWCRIISSFASLFI